MFGEIIGPDLLIILALVLVLFGGSQLPKLARGLGTALREFKMGLDKGHDDSENDSENDSEDSTSDSRPTLSP